MCSCHHSLWYDVSKYRLKAPMSAILEKSSGEYVHVTLPTGAMLRPTSQPSTTLLGLVGVLWEGRHYSVSLAELLQTSERVQSA